MMKIKFIFPLILAIFIGFFSAKIVYGLYSDKNTTFYNGEYIPIKIVWIKLLKKKALILI